MFSRRGVKVRTRAGTNCWAELSWAAAGLGLVTAKEGEVSPVAAQELLYTNHCRHCHCQGYSHSPSSNREFGKSG